MIRPHGNQHASHHIITRLFDELTLYFVCPSVDTHTFLKFEVKASFCVPLEEYSDKYAPISTGIFRRPGFFLAQASLSNPIYVEPNEELGLLIIHTHGVGVRTCREGPSADDAKNRVRPERQKTIGRARGPVRV